MNAANYNLKEPMIIAVFFDVGKPVNDNSYYYEWSKCIGLNIEDPENN